MIFQLLEVVMPVFIVIGAGYAAVKFGMFTKSAADGLMFFTQGIAIPCLLFLNIMRLDFGEAFDWRLLTSFYVGSFTCFALGIFGARIFFKRRPGDSVVIGFSATFSNSILLGIPITERAFGAGALAGNYALVSIHAPLIYLIGITVMEASRADGRGVAGTTNAVAKAMFRNTLMIGIGLGAAVNLSGLTLPETVISATEMISRAALPAALFGLGGTLTHYSLRASIGEAGMISVIKLTIHPAIAYFLAAIVFDLSEDFVRSAVVTASMAPGVNAYVFASMYNRAKGAAASAVLLGTMISILSASMWLWILA